MGLIGDGQQAKDDMISVKSGLPTGFDTVIICLIAVGLPPVIDRFALNGFDSSKSLYLHRLSAQVGDTRPKP